MDMINGKDDTIDFEDFLGGQEYYPIDFHTMMEARLNI
jgi:hypothetical protein